MAFVIYKLKLNENQDFLRRTNEVWRVFQQREHKYLGSQQNCLKNVLIYFKVDICNKIKARHLYLQLNCLLKHKNVKSYCFGG